VSAVRIVCAALVALSVSGQLRADDDATARHLLQGVRAFKAERYDEALVELRMVARGPNAPADLAYYLGPTLYKLHRFDEALAVFLASRAAPDALTDFYLGQTYYQLRLFRKAHALFADLRARGLGPALHEAAGRYIALVDATYQAPPQAGSIDYYLSEGVARAASTPVVAGEYLDEARQVEALAREPHRHLEILEALAAAWNDGGRPQLVLGLAIEPAPSLELTWQRARAYVATGDAAHARPLLDAIGKANAARAAEAAALRAQLPP
jgi:uncharacterized protein HemY